MAQLHRLIPLYISAFCLITENQITQSTSNDNDTVNTNGRYIFTQIFDSVNLPKIKNISNFETPFAKEVINQITNSNPETKDDDYLQGDTLGIKFFDDFYNSVSNELSQVNEFLLESILKKVEKLFAEWRRAKLEKLAKQASIFGSPNCKEIRSQLGRPARGQVERGGATKHWPGTTGVGRHPSLNNKYLCPRVLYVRVLLMYVLFGYYVFKNNGLNFTKLKDNRSERDGINLVAVTMKKLANFFEETLGPEVMSVIDTTMTWLHYSLPAEYYRELNGLSMASGISVARVTLYNVFYELSTVCTSIVMEAEDGKMYHGRNLDFGLIMGWDAKNHTWFLTEILRPLIIKVDFLKNGKPIYSAVTYAGYTGILTGIKKNSFSLSIDERFVLDGSFVGLVKWILGVRDSSWLGLLTRQVMEAAASYDEAQRMLARTPLLAPVYFILAGNTSHKGSVLTRGRRDVDIWPLGSRHRQQNGSWFLVQTNYDHWKETPSFDNRRQYAVQCMDEIGREKPLETLYRVLSTRPILNKETTFTAVMDVREGLLEVWQRDCPDPCWPF